MAYTEKNYVDLTGLGEFKRMFGLQLEEQVAGMISDATDSMASTIEYNESTHSLEVQTATETFTAMSVDTAVTENSNFPVTSGAVYDIIGDVESLLAAI